MDNYATVNWTAGSISAGVAPVWNNTMGSVFDMQADVVIAYAGSGYLTFNNHGTLKKSAGGGTSTLQCVTTNTGKVQPQSGTLDLQPTYTQTAGLTEMAGGNLAGTLLDIQGGLLTGTGNVAANVRNAAQVAPGTGVGVMTLLSPQTYTATTNSQIAFQIGGLTPGSGHDQLRLNNGTATLAGTLYAGLTNGYVPASGNTYTVMTFTARSGTFTNFSFPDYEFGVIHTANQVILVASNARPTVTLSGAVTQLVCTPLQLTASVNDLDGSVTNLQLFLNGTNLLANYNNPPHNSPQKLTLTYDFPSTVNFSAVATDDKGYTKTAAVATVYYTLPLHVLNLGGLATNGTFKFCMLGETGSNYVVLATTNVTEPASNWLNLGLMESTNGIWRFLDHGTLTNRHERYYRALRQ